MPRILHDLAVPVPRFAAFCASPFSLARKFPGLRAT
jgi:hypothetical protein